jgi:hypothetical protein
MNEIACSLELSGRAVERSLPAVPEVAPAGARPTLVEVAPGVWGAVVEVAYPLDGPVRVLCEPSGPPPSPPEKETP